MAAPAHSDGSQRSRRGPRPVRRWPALAVGIIAVGLTVAACGSSPAASTGTTTSAPPTSTASSAVLSTASTPLGTILVDHQGKTVYLFASDSPGHSTCNGSCLTYWPIVAAPSPVPASVPGVTAKLGSITRPDGTRQLTVNGWPVYTYAADTAPGMTSGQGTNGSGGLWWVISASGTAMKSTAGSSTPTPTPSTSTSSSSGGGWG
jgi:predicted lipoprotein with Yx(FWY)xxD motif